MTSSPESGVFNLIAEAWLPVRRRSGALERIPPWRITDGMADDPFVAFAWPRPDFDGAAHEFLIGLLSTAAAPEDDDTWADWWLSPPVPEELKRRVEPLAHAFDLDGPGPRFMQDLDPLEGAEDKDIAALLIDAPGAQTLRNNADLFVKRGGVAAMCRSAAAMALYALNAFAPAGGAGHRTSLRGGGPLTTLVVADREGGSTLWGRLWPNVESEEQIARRNERERRCGDLGAIFPWLVPTRTSKYKAGGQVTTPADVHPLQVYWGMPRRIRLVFEEAEGQPCGLTGVRDSSVVRTYRSKNYGTDYSEGFAHPLTPYYRQNAKQTARLPVHPRPGGISYRLWPGLVVPSGDGLRDPAQAVRRWPERALDGSARMRVVAFGYDMDNMKARAWVESEMPLWLLRDKGTRSLLEAFVRQTSQGAGTVARLLTGAVKSALHQRPTDAPGDRGFIAERFFHETEMAFHEVVDDAATAIKGDPNGDDPTLALRGRWVPAMAEAALRLFDEYAPADGLQERAMHRHVKARFHLTIALAGRGAAGRSLFKDLDIPFPAQARKGEQAA